jgi:hypothetical protein
MAGHKAQTLNSLFLDALPSEIIRRHSDIREKPMEVDFNPQFFPEKIRLYLYTISHPPGGRGYGDNDVEFKITIKLPEHEPNGNTKANFDDSGERTPILAGFEEDYFVFVLWDAMGYRDISYNRNIQVKGSTIIEATARGISYQFRRLRKTGRKETILACNAVENKLCHALWARAYVTNTVPEKEGEVKNLIFVSGQGFERAFPEVFGRS